MTAATEKHTLHRDHYKATLKNANLVMIPYCACGNVLNDDYFCEFCNRRCHCTHIICDNRATLDMVQKYIRESSQFDAFTTSLAKES
jgi:hypothetical protein